MTRVTCWLTAKNWDQLRNPMLGNRLFTALLIVKYLRALAPGSEGANLQLRLKCLSMDSSSVAAKNFQER